MKILEEKEHTKRPAIVAAATRLFAKRGIDATSMRDVAAAAGVREAAIYRHFRGKEEMAREVFASWYRWYSEQVRAIAGLKGPLRETLLALVHLEFEAARKHPLEFLYFCDNEARFLRAIPEGYSARSAGTGHHNRGWTEARGDPCGRSRTLCRHAQWCALRGSNIGD